jgi:pimeloyl-ACP methyl ester carboxylesterase
VCPFPLPAGELELTTMECGYSISLENHLDTVSYELAVAFAILYARQPQNPPPAPLIVLADQPGQSILAALEVWAASPLRENRDLILYEGRGAGFSVDAFAGAARIDLNGGYSTAERDCYTRLINASVDLSTYNSAQSAADLADLRAGLSRERGYTSYNLYGSGYGARLALTVLRDSPVGVRSVILDSPLPPRANLIDEQGRVVSGALRRLFDDCAANEACNTAYPNLEQTFSDTFVRLSAVPITYQVLNPDGTTNSVTVTGNSFLQIVVDSLADTSFLPLLPLFIVRISEGDYSVLGARAPEIGGASLSEGVRSSHLCREEILFNSQTNALSYASAFAEPLRDSLLALTDVWFATCGVWSVGEANVLETAAVFSGIPALVLSGAYDPFASPEWGALTAETLSASFYVPFPATGHGVLGSGACAVGISQRFLNDPLIPPDTSCAAALTTPAFVIR